VPRGGGRGIVTGFEDGSDMFFVPGESAATRCQQLQTLARLVDSDVAVTSGAGRRIILHDLVLGRPTSGNVMVG
jgi:hypothetical protein